MKKIALTIAVLFIVFTCFSQQTAIFKELIPISLRQNAHAVVQESDEVFEIKSKNKAFYKIHKVITILDEQGKEYLEFVGYSDKFHQLQDVDIRMFDANGVQQKKYVKKDLFSFYAGDGLVTDTKYYVQRFLANSYPVTVQYDYQVKYDGLLHLPSYDIQYPFLSIRQSSFTCIVNEDADVRFSGQNTNLEPVVTKEKGNIVYKWSSSNLPALLYEEGGVSSESSYPKIILAPNQFELDGYAGDMSSWQKFGTWYRDLAKNLDKLPPERIQYLNNLVAPAHNEKEKIKLIYEYLQKNFRYVSIQLGIGGYKPFAASFVDDKKYGDCKALSNYMQACLAAVGIKSYQALINASYNKKPVEDVFPYQGFNHVILCVPGSRDTTWLECTSSTSDFGVLGSFTENRNALLVTEDGGKLIATPRSVSVSNQLHSYSVIKISADGSGMSRTSLQTTGSFHSAEFITDKKDDQKNYLTRGLGFLLPDEFEVKSEGRGKYDITLEMEKIPDFIAGDKMFLNPRLNKMWRNSFPVTNHRTKDFYFEQPFIKTDTTEYFIPPGYKIEALPANKTLSFAAGTFSSSYSVDETKNCIITTARLELKNHIIPASGYESMVKFFTEAGSEFGQKVIIRKM